MIMAALSRGLSMKVYKCSMSPFKTLVMTNDIYSICYKWDLHHHHHSSNIIIRILYI